MHAAFELLTPATFDTADLAKIDQVAEEILHTATPASAAALVGVDQLLNMGMTWTLETATKRYTADFPPNMNTEKAVFEAAHMWEQVMCEHARPAVFRALPTSNPDRWLLIAADDDPQKVDFAVVQPVRRSALYTR